MAHEKYAGWGPEVAPPPGQVLGQPAMPAQQQVPGLSANAPAQQQVPGQPAMPAQVTTTRQCQHKFQDNQ